MQPEAQFTAYDSLMEPIEGMSGGAEMWSESVFTDSEGAERTLRILPVKNGVIRYLEFSEGAFTDKEGNSSPEMRAKYSFTASSSFYGYSKSLVRLQTVKTDADFSEGDMVAYPQLSTGMPASYFGLLIKTDEGVSSAKLTYDENHDLVCPARVGTAEYTLIFCGQPIGKTETLKTISSEEYQSLYEKDRRLSRLRGMALIPCLPGYVLFYTIQVTVTYLILTTVMPPDPEDILPTIISAPAQGAQRGFENWRKTVGSLVSAAKTNTPLNRNVPASIQTVRTNDSIRFGVDDVFCIVVPSFIMQRGCTKRKTGQIKIYVNGIVGEIPFFDTIELR